MISRLSTVGLLATSLFAACASGGAVSPGRPSASPGTPTTDNPIPLRTCGASNTSVAPADGLLADFSAKKGLIITSVDPVAAPTTTLTQSSEGGHLTVTVKAVPGPRPQFLSTTMLFQGCIDASGFTGVQFSLSGALSGCALVFDAVDPEHQWRGPGGPYPPQRPIAATEVTAQPQTIMAPFANPGIQGNPATPAQASSLTAVQWIVVVPVGASDGTSLPACTGSLTIDDVKLYR